MADANEALADLRTAQPAVVGIQSTANAVAAVRRQREADETALTNNSLLIKHVSDNKLLSDALLADLEAG